MRATGETARAAGDGMFFGWKVVAACFVMAVFAWGFGFYGPSVFLHQIHATRGWSVGVISSAITVHFLWGAILVVFLGDFYRRFGVVPSTLFGVVVFAAGVLAWAHARESWQLFPAAIATGTGWTLTSGTAINALIAPWFDRRRPLALAHAYNGASAGGFVMTPIWTALIAAYDFETAALIMTAAALVVLLPVIGLIFSATPASRGVSPDGVTAAANPVTAALRSARAVQRPPLSRGRFLANRNFMALAVGFALAIFAQMGILAHLVTRLAPVLGAREAAWALSFATFAAVIGRFGAVALVGARNHRRLAAGNFLMQAVGVGLLIVGETPVALLAGCLLFGLGIGNLLSLPPLILQAELDRADVVRAFALMSALNQVFYGFAPGVLGALRDVTDNYAAPFLLAAGIQVLAAIVVLLGGRAAPPR